MDDYGPAMRALNEMQRKFVLAMAADPFGSQKDWAIAAGYSDVSDGAKVRGHHLVHNPKIQAAVYEVSRALMQTNGPMIAAVGMLKIAQNPNHPRHTWALEALANRVGLHEQTEHTVRVEHTDRTGKAMAERISALAQQLGMDASKLLGVNEPKLIENVPADEK